MDKVEEELKMILKVNIGPPHTHTHTHMQARAEIQDQIDLACSFVSLWNNSYGHSRKAFDWLVSDLLWVTAHQNQPDWRQNISVYKWDAENTEAAGAQSPRSAPFGKI